VLQLRLWPQVVFKDVLDVTIDPLDIEQKTLYYMLRVKTVPRGKDLLKRASIMEGWVRSLLGDDWVFNIKGATEEGWSWQAGVPRPAPDSSGCCCCKAPRPICRPMSSRMR
jgi:hypothetical protein